MRLIALLTLFAAGLNAAGSCSIVNNAGPGTVQIAANGVVTGTSTSFAANTVLGSPGIGSQICVAGTCAFITAFSSSTAVTVGGGSWSGTTAGGQSYTIQQVVHPNGTNNTNIVQFFANFAAGSTLLHGAWIDVATSERPQLITTALGESFTSTPNSHANGANTWWLSYLISTFGGTNTIYFGNPSGNGDFYDDVYGMEISCTGGLVSFDTDKAGNASYSLPNSAASGVIWTVGRTATAGFQSPLTSTPRTTSAGIFGYQMNPSSPTTIAIGAGGVGSLAASLKIIQPQPTGFGGTGGIGGQAGLNVPNTNAVIGAPVVCGVAFSNSAVASKTTAACDTRGATVIVIGANINLAASTITFSDSAGNTWSNCVSSNFSGFNLTKVCSAINPNTSATHTFTATAGSNTTISVGAEAISNTPITASALDPVLSAGAFSSTATAYPSYQLKWGFGLIGTGLQPKTPGEFIFLFCGSHNSPATFSMTSPFTLDASSGASNYSGFMGHYVSTNGAGVNPSCTVSTTGLNAIMVGFQPLP